MFDGLFVVIARPWPLLENIIVGPVVAVLSFVCSVGNVPWRPYCGRRDRVRRGDRVVFADLIMLPIVLAYRGDLRVSMRAHRGIDVRDNRDCRADRRWAVHATGLIPSARPTRADMSGSDDQLHAGAERPRHGGVRTLLGLTRSRRATDPGSG